MGYFAYAYVVEGSADNEGVTLSTSLYAGPVDRPTFFSWGEGDRSQGLHAYAGGTLYSEADLSVLRGYPRTQRLGDRPGENPNLVLIDEAFTPFSEAEPVLFHFVLPPRFVPSRNRTPMAVPKDSWICRHGDLLTTTFVTKGGGKVCFWISRLQDGEQFDDYDLNSLFNAPSTKAAKVSFELNLGIVKIAIGDR
jgi:hypothetical protein